MRRTSQTSLIALATACAFAATPPMPKATGDPSTPTVEPAGRAMGSRTLSSPRRGGRKPGHPAVGRDGHDETLAINSGGADIRGLSGRVPSLNIESSFGRTFPRFYIRGLGNTDSTSTHRSRSAWSMTTSSWKTRS